MPPYTAFNAAWAALNPVLKKRSAFSYVLFHCPPSGGIFPPALAAFPVLAARPDAAFIPPQTSARPIRTFTCRRAFASTRRMVLYNQDTARDSSLFNAALNKTRRMFPCNQTETTAFLLLARPETKHAAPVRFAANPPFFAFPIQTPGKQVLKTEKRTRFLLRRTVSA